MGPLRLRLHMFMGVGEVVDVFGTWGVPNGPSVHEDTRLVVVDTGPISCEKNVLYKIIHIIIS